MTFKSSSLTPMVTKFTPRLWAAHKATFPSKAHPVLPAYLGRDGRATNSCTRGCGRSDINIGNIMELYLKYLNINYEFQL
jgi:hypothetical protein